MATHGNRPTVPPESHEERFANSGRTGKRGPDPTGYLRQHERTAALSRPLGPYKRPDDRHGLAMSLMVRGWAKYADAHRARFETGIGDDYVLGPEWSAIGFALIGLLNGELGGFDGGTLDAFLRDSLAAEGFDPS
jgi:hypothetical protein